MSCNCTLLQSIPSCFNSLAVAKVELLNTVVWVITKNIATGFNEAHEITTDGDGLVKLPFIIDGGYLLPISTFEVQVFDINGIPLELTAINDDLVKDTCFQFSTNYIQGNTYTDVTLRV